MPPTPAPPSPLLVIVAAPVSVPGVEDCLTEAERAAASGADVRVLFTEDGLALLASPWPERLARAGAAASLCTRSARARRVAPEGVPAVARWSSLTTFLGAAPAGARLWAAFP